MSLRIGTNIASLAAQRSLTSAQRKTEHSLRRLASGSKVASPGTDAAGFAIGEQLRADIAGLKVAKSNAQGAVSLVQVAEGGLNEQFNIAVRLRELAVLSASDSVSDVEREYLDEEYQQLTSEFDRIAQTTQMGRDKLLVNDSTKEYSFLVGPTGAPDETITVQIDANTSASNLDLAGLSVADQDDSTDVLENLDTALEELGRVRSKFGAVQARFFHAIDTLSVQSENKAEARSRIVDTDIAEETAKLAQAKILKEAATGVLTQANQSPLTALRLLG